MLFEQFQSFRNLIGDVLLRPRSDAHAREPGTGLGTSLNIHRHCTVAFVGVRTNMSPVSRHGYSLGASSQSLSPSPSPHAEFLTCGKKRYNVSTVQCTCFKMLARIAFCEEVYQLEKCFVVVLSY